MLECGMEVILVKVAGVGLGIDLVGKSLRDIMPLLRRLVSRSISEIGGTDDRNQDMVHIQQGKVGNMKL